MVHYNQTLQQTTKGQNKLELHEAGLRNTKLDSSVL